MFANTAATAMTVRQLGSGHVMNVVTSTGSSAFFVNSSGQTGFGTTNPAASVDVTGNVYASNAVTTTNVFATTVSGTNVIGTHYGVLAGSNTVSGSTQTLGGTAGVTTLNVTGNLYASNAVTTTNVFTTNVFATGRIGIGTANPGYTLDVSGIIRATSNIYLGAGGTGGTGTTIDSFSTYQRIQSWNSLPLAINPLGNNVGIGTTSPGSPLHVYKSQNSPLELRVENPSTGTGAVSQISFLTNDASGSGGRGGLAVFNSTYTAANQYRPSGTYLYNNGTGGVTIASEAAQPIYFATSNAERMRIDSSGNVGIGTTSPACQLHLYNTTSGGQIGIGMQTDSTSYMRMGMDNSYVQYICNNAFWTGSAYNYVNTVGYSGQATRIQQYNGTFGVDTASGGTNPISFTNRLYIANGGNVGIGTSSPGYKLDVSSFAVDGGTIRIASSSSCQFRMMEVNDMYGFSFTNVAASRMSIKRHSASSAGSEIISIMRDNPYVGIGTTNPGSSLSFGNPIVNKIITLYDGNPADPVSTATNFYGFGINGGTLRYQTDSTGSQHLFYNGGTAYYRINSAGGANVSDKRFKSEVEPISNALATVQQLQGITFKMQDLEKRQMGFIAQDVADVVPEVVSYDEGCDSHFLSYDKLTALLCEGIKELSSENTALKARLDSLESRLAAAGI